MKNLIRIKFVSNKYLNYFFSSCSQSMADKLYRLEYVAIARGVKRDFWTEPKGSDGTFARFRK